MTHCGLVLLWMCACAMGRKQSTLWPFQLLNGHGFQSCQDCSFNRSDAAFVWSNIWILRSISLLVCYWCDILIKLSLQQEITSFKRMLIVLIQPFLRISTYNMTLFQTVVYHQRCSRAARFSDLVISQDLIVLIQLTAGSLTTQKYCCSYYIQLWSMDQGNST